MASKPKPELVNGYIARKALEMAKGDRKAAYTQCILLSFRSTGSLAPGFDNRDLQAWYDTNLNSQGDQDEK